MIAWPPNTHDIATARSVLAALQKHGASWIVQYVGLANADYEANFDPNAKGDYLDASGHLLPWAAHPSGTPSAFGMWQRQKVRCDIIRDGIPHKGIKGLGIDLYGDVMAGKNTIDHDAQAFVWELENRPEFGLAAIKAAKTVRAATIIACEKFEIATTSASDRGQRAEAWLKVLG